MTLRPRTPARRWPTNVALAVVVVALLSSSVLVGLATASAAATQGGLVTRADSGAHFPIPPAVPSATVGSVALPISAGSVGAVVATAYLNYNASTAGNFPTSVFDWDVGKSAVDPSTGQLWMPEWPITVDNIPAPPSAPGLVYNPVTNETRMIPNLSNTSAIAFDPLNGDFYATDPLNNTVLVIDPSTGAMVQPAIRVGTNPMSIEYDPVSQNLFVANEVSNNITVINGTHSDVQVSIAGVGTTPIYLADDTTDHLLYIADSGENKITSITTTTDAIGPTISLPAPASAVAFDAQHDLLGFDIPSKNQFQVDYANSQSTAGLVMQALTVSTIVVNENGSDFVTANETTPDLVVVPAESGAIVAAFVGVRDIPGRLTMNSPANLLYSWSGVNRTVTAFNLSAKAVQQFSPDLGARAATLAFDPGSVRVFVGDWMRNTVEVLNASTFATAQAPIVLPNAATGLVDDPATGVVYAGFSGGVAAIDAETGAIVEENHSLPGNNSQLIIDPATDLLWEMNILSGLQALTIPGLSVVHVLRVGVGTTNLEGVTLDTANDELFAADLTNHTIAVVNGSTGREVGPAISGLPDLISVAYDPADQEVYALGYSVWILDPTTRSVVAGPLPIAPHFVAWEIVYDPSREDLYVPSNGTPSPPWYGNVSVIDGSSIAASEGSYATIAAGQLPINVLPVELPGSTVPGSGELWVANFISGTVSILASPPQVTYFAATPNPIDVGGTSSLQLGEAGGAGPSQFSYTGLPAGCVSADTAALSCTPVASGTYPITAEVVDSLGFSTSAETMLSVSPAIDVQLELDSGTSAETDLGMSVTGTASASGGTAPFNYSWSFGDSGLGWGSSVTHLYAAVGVYPVTVVVTDAGGGISSATSTVTVVVLPTVSVSVSPSNITDVNVPLTLTGTVAGGTTPGNASWTFGDGTSSTGTTAHHTYSSAGAYIATFHYRDASGSTASQAVVVQVNPAIAATITVAPNAAGAAITAGTLLDFNTTISGGTRPFTVEWGFDDGSFGTGIAIQHSYGAAGTYTVNLLVEDAAGAQSNTTYRLTVAAAPGASGSATSLDTGLLLGILIGAVVAALILFAVARPRKKKRPPAPPSAYVPPAALGESPVVPEAHPWQES
ncbi:MAG: PKD domain-containing protein [Thermoplasmata archaeon]